MAGYLDLSLEVATPALDSAADYADGNPSLASSLLLVATVGVMSLPTPRLRPAFRTTIALATLAADTDREYGPTSRVAANPKAKNSVVVHVHIRHKEIMPPGTG